MRNPAKDQVAIVGVGVAPYTRQPGAGSSGALAAQACVAAIRDAGLGAADVDGVCGSSYADVEMQIALGLPEVTWGASPRVPFCYQILEAVNAVYAGACTTAVVYHSTYRRPGTRELHQDPLRERASSFGASSATPWRARLSMGPLEPGTQGGGVGYAAWAQRYLDEYGATREAFGRIAVNNRSNALQNPNAVMRAPMTFDDYYAARMIREPLGLLDLDVPVDAADALVVTTAERARDLPNPAVLVHAATIGRTARCREDQVDSLTDTGQDVVARTLWGKSDLTLADVDVFLPYDGFTMISTMWFESIGYCGPGEAEGFLRDHWDDARNRIMIDGRVPVNPHGGNLSEGATQGSGAVREGVVQLRGAAGERQAADASVALVTPGGIVWNAGGILLRTAG